MFSKMKNKVAILTQPLGHNYGGIMQNYALQNVLVRLNYEPLTLDIKLKNNYFLALSKKMTFKRRLYTFLLNETKHRLEGRRKIIPSNYYFNYIHKNTFRFLENYINRSATLYTTEEIKKVFEMNEFSHVIVGSDQVWRPIYSPNIYNFYLDFLEDNKEIKKISYAASFGTSDWEYDEEQTSICKKLIDQFDEISVREFGGINLCNRYLNVEAQVVLDPTMLLTKEDYIKLFKNTKKERKGIFSYVLDINERKKEVLKQFQKELNLDVFYNEPKAYFHNNNNLSPENYQIPKLEGWVKAFYEADFVLTDSFHGTVFSILFRKNFVVLINEERGSDRFLTLLKSLDLENRIFSNEKNLEEFVKSEINYDLVEEKLSILRSKSISFLKESLNISK